MLKRLLLLLLLANGMSLVAMDTPYRPVQGAGIMRPTYSGWMRVSPEQMEEARERYKAGKRNSEEADTQFFEEFISKFHQMPSEAPTTLAEQHKLETLVGKDFANRYYNISPKTWIMIRQYTPGLKDNSTPQEKVKAELLLKTIEILQPKARL